MTPVSPSSRLPTRLRILDYLRRHQAASALELSRALRMTVANVRHHLAVLVSNDVLQVVGQQREGRGRPKQVYGLSRRLLGDGLDELASQLLSEWLGGLAEERREQALRRLALRLAGAETGAGGALPARLARLVQRLEALHYQARWEAGAAGARLILGHCPYAAVIAEHPELCRMDAFLIEAFLQQAVTQTAKRERAASGLPQCVFVAR
ncbi:MAG: helix-turn-helix domain-containing protein [Anaerolineales bacterium]